jgi:hypothetical protein
MKIFYIYLKKGKNLYDEISIIEILFKFLKLKDLDNIIRMWF